MKKLLLILTLSLMANFCFAQNELIEIGKLENGIPVLTANVENMCKSLSKNLAKVSNVVDNFTSAKIVKMESAFYLVFKASKYTTTFLVIEDDGKLMGQMNVSCSSTGDFANSIGSTVSQIAGECLCIKSKENSNSTKTCSSGTLVENF